MCLRKFKKLPRIATKDIEVYKIVQISDKFPNELWTTFRNYQVEIGKTYKGQDLRIKGLIKSLFIKRLKWDIFTLFECIYFNTYGHFFFNKANMIVKYIIPKGTLYFIGEDREIASRKLKYVELCA